MRDEPGPFLYEEIVEGQFEDDGTSLCRAGLTKNGDALFGFILPEDYFFLRL